MSPARAITEAFAALPVVGSLFGLILLPAWCVDSLARDATRTNRNVVSIARWAFVWAIALVAALAILTVIFVLVGAGLPIGLAWLVGPIVVGAIVGTRARGLGGFGVGALGLLAGGAMFGVVGWLIALVMRLSGSTSVSDPIAALGYVPLATALVPILTAAQFGIGVAVMSATESVLGLIRGERDAVEAPIGASAIDVDRTSRTATLGPTPPMAGTLAAEAASALDASRGLRGAAATRVPAGFSGTRAWALLIGGIVLGLALTFAVYVPAGEPDAAEVTFGLSLLTIGGGIGLGRALRGGRFAPAGRVFLGLAIGAAIGFVLVFFTPILGA